ncbi:hypothetical protein BHE74_00009725 [Ensete ventricosum]|nr:hypothetical protein GW17_00001214 [Ensete ventricosum]RWW81851.1 hypothetical protein BHE74_00009725 [Ensete ventricosum]RZS25340.1 hypothetical protein BHM03_00058527 [Ensete ventricosum]
MDIFLLEVLLDSIAQFSLVSSNNNVKPELVQRYCQKIDRILEQFEPVCNEIAASKITLDEQLVKVLKELDSAVNEARELVLNWFPVMSKIYFVSHNWTDSASEAVSNNDHIEGPGDANMVSQVSSDLTHYSSDTSGELAQDAQASSAPQREPDFPPRLVDARARSQSMFRRASVSRIISSQSMDSRPDLSGVESQVRKLIEDLKSDSADMQRTATEELRLLAKHSMENRIVIANCGAISLLVGRLHSTDPKTQEHAVTALLNLSLNDNNKIAIGNADSIDPLIHVLETGNPEAKENSAATLYSISGIEENKVRIGRSRAIGPLVELLANGTPRGKKDAATALFNLSIFHENKLRIVQAGAVRHLVELMDPAAGMVDKAVAVLSNLATIPEGRTAIGQAGGIPVLVEVVELGSARGKENAAAALLHLCTNSGRFCSLVLQEGAVPPLVALSQSGTPRAKEKVLSIPFYFFGSTIMSVLGFSCFTNHKVLLVLLGLAYQIYSHRDCHAWPQGHAGWHMIVPLVHGLSSGSQ